MNNDYQQPGQNEFHQNVFGSMPPPSSKDSSRGFAIASLCLGIASFICFCCCSCALAFFTFVSPVCAILSIVFACIARSRNQSKMPGMAIAGMILSIIFLVLFALLIGFVLVIAANADAVMEWLEAFVYENTGMTMEEFMNSEYYQSYYGDYYAQFE